VQPEAVPGVAFTAREWDPASVLYYYRARWYDPGVGRFLGEDPLGFDDGPNRFLYVGNNPVRRRDPSGTTWMDAWYCLKYPQACTIGTAPCYFAAQDLERQLTGGSGSDNDRNNAIKHCFWSCCVARASSYKIAIEITNAHESDDWNNPGRACSSEMDRTNNVVGASLGANTSANCADGCKRAKGLQCQPRKANWSKCAAKGS
jgi:RHS repeat-associated protein